MRSANLSDDFLVHVTPETGVNYEIVSSAGTGTDENECIFYIAMQNIWGKFTKAGVSHAGLHVRRAGVKHPILIEP